jgi:uncharacterized protein YbjT (DUF2867 family)
VAVVGGTGLIGRHVVGVLREAGVATVSMSRREGVDVTTGEGLDHALHGVQRVIDVSNAGTTSGEPAAAFFTAAAQHLHEAGERAGVDRLVVLSIVGIDRLSTGYWAAKRAHEQAAQGGPIPALVLRATQFHEFAGQVLEWGRRGEVSTVPEMLVQPVAAEAAARVLVDLALASGLAATVTEAAGPRQEELVDMATHLAARRNDPVQVQGVRDPTRDGEAVAAGALLPGPDATLTGPGFQEWLDAGEHVPPRSG